MEKKFKELYLAAEVEFEELDRFVSKWKFSEENTPLREYLGINGDEEDVWIEEGDEALQEMFDKLHK